MYVIDDKGQVLIDSEFREAVDKAERSRTLSPRASALVRGAPINLGHLVGNAEHGYALKVLELVKNVALRLGLTTKSNRHFENANGLDTQVPFLIQLAIEKTLSRGLAGFPGVIPVAHFSGWDNFLVVLPADGAMIRYLDRAMRNSSMKEFLRINVQPATDRDSYSTIDGGSLASKRDVTMYIRVQLTPRRYPGSTGTTVNKMLRAMAIRKELEAVSRVVSTISRRFFSVCGTWGEFPKFPILNSHLKMPTIMSQISLGTEGFPSIHGNNASYFGDKSVYDAMDGMMKLPFTTSATRDGVRYEWKDPRRK